MIYEADLSFMSAEWSVLVPTEAADVDFLLLALT